MDLEAEATCGNRPGHVLNQQRDARTDPIGILRDRAQAIIG